MHERFQRRKHQQCAWDAEEARDLRAAEAVQIWTQYGCVTLVEYLEVRCGIEPRTALERIRVAHALAELPLLEAELEAGTYQQSHVRELTRVVVADTEAEWVAYTRGMTFREVQRAVAGHVRGDRPTDPTQPNEHLRHLGFRLKPSTIARFTAVLSRLQSERGDAFVDDDDKVNALCDAIGSSSTAHEPAQVWLTTDGHGYANGTELDDAELATLTCDATLMGDVADPHARTAPQIPRRQRQRLLARDGNECAVPGCRSRRHLDLHHVEHREHGGTHADDNLITLCGGHHRLHHRGLLAITGTAPTHLTFRRANPDEDDEHSCTRVRGNQTVNTRANQQRTTGEGLGV